MKEYFRKKVRPLFWYIFSEIFLHAVFKISVKFRIFWDPYWPILIVIFCSEKELFLLFWCEKRIGDIKADKSFFCIPLPTQKCMNELQLQKHCSQICTPPYSLVYCRHHPGPKRFHGLPNVLIIGLMSPHKIWKFADETFWDGVTSIGPEISWSPGRLAVPLLLPGRKPIFSHISSGLHRRSYAHSHPHYTSIPYYGILVLQWSSSSQSQNWLRYQGQVCFLFGWVWGKGRA